MPSGNLCCPLWHTVGDGLWSPGPARTAQSAAETHSLTVLTNFVQNAILGLVALVHVCMLTRASSYGLAGPLVCPKLCCSWGKIVFIR